MGGTEGRGISARMVVRQGWGSYFWIKGLNMMGLGGEDEKQREKLEKWRSPMRRFSSLGASSEVAWFSSLFRFENRMAQIIMVGNLCCTSSQV